MIFSSIYANDDTTKYPAGIQKAVEYLKNNDFIDMEPGTYAIDGDEIYAMVMDLTTAPLKDKRPEIHKKYVDVQFLVTGKERLGFAPDQKNQSIVDGNEENDIYFYSDVEDEGFVVALPGCYSVFFPNDIHRPGVMNGDKPELVRKVVVKVSINQL